MVYDEVAGTGPPEVRKTKLRGSLAVACPGTVKLGTYLVLPLLAPSSGIFWSIPPPLPAPKGLPLMAPEQLGAPSLHPNVPPYPGTPPPQNAI